MNVHIVACYEPNVSDWMDGVWQVKANILLICWIINMLVRLMRYIICCLSGHTMGCRFVYE